MPAERGRHRRVAALVQRELAVLLQRRENLAAGAGLLTLSHVRVSPDLSVADAYITVLPCGEAVPVAAGDAAPRQEAPEITATLEALAAEASELRRALAAQVSLRFVPLLRFHHFSGPRRAARLDALLDALPPGKPPDGIS